MVSIKCQMGGHGVFVGSGGGMPQPRGMHQPGMHQMNPSQGLRAQVPHQFLSAQVCCLLSLMLLVRMNLNAREMEGLLSLASIDIHNHISDMQDAYMLMC